MLTLQLLRDDDNGQLELLSDKQHRYSVCGMRYFCLQVTIQVLNVLQHSHVNPVAKDASLQ